MICGRILWLVVLLTLTILTGCGRGSSTAPVEGEGEVGNAAVQPAGRAPSSSGQDSVDPEQRDQPSRQRGHEAHQSQRPRRDSYGSSQKQPTSVRHRHQQPKLSQKERKINREEGETKPSKPDPKPGEAASSGSRNPDKDKDAEG
jgi:hypothetical protein